MRPVLFEPFGVPIYGYGFMLFLAFLACNFVAKRLCKREGIDPNPILDMIIWLFITGIAGARIVYVIQYWHTDPPRNPVGFDQRPIWDVFKLWDGGLVFYGSVFGGLAGYFAYWWFILRPKKVSTWKMLDVVAPCVAVGLALGRVGCLFTGCCYGNVACDTCPAIHFPINSMPSHEMMRRGLQTELGIIFKRDSLEVAATEPGSAAEAVGVKRGDTLVAINDDPVLKSIDVHLALQKLNAAHQTEVALTVLRDGTRFNLAAFVPTSIGLNPTQIYETISMTLLLFFLLSYYPFKRHDGELMVFLMFGYGVHRFLNEMLRTDTDPVAFGLTLSQNISVIVLIAGAILAIVVWCRPRVHEAPPPLAA